MTLNITPKTLMAGTFGMMALPCMLHPELVLQLSFSERLQPQRDSPQMELSLLLMRCFGSQAMLTSIAMAIGNWNDQSHKVWIASIIPFFFFDAMAWNNGMLTVAGAAGDAIGNVVFVSCSALSLLKRKKA
jgi:hypothetical protein